MSTKKQLGNITRRDGYIMRKALAYAIEAIARLPEEWQEMSDREDMIEILETITTPPEVEFHRVSVRSKLEQRGLTIVDGKMVLMDREPPTSSVM